MSAGTYDVMVLSEGCNGSALSLHFITDSAYDFNADSETCLERDVSITEYNDAKGDITKFDCTVSILDTSGQKEYTSMLDHWMRHGSGFLLVYSITSHESLEQIEQVRNKLLRILDDANVSMVLVGAECELEDDREVSYEEGKLLAQKWGCPFFEVSTETDVNVEECFHEVVRQMRKLDRTQGVVRASKTLHNTVSPVAAAAKKAVLFSIDAVKKRLQSKPVANEEEQTGLLQRPDIDVNEKGWGPSQIVQPKGGDRLSWVKNLLKKRV